MKNNEMPGTADVSNKLNPKQVATMLSVSVHQVRAWANDGTLKAYRLSPHILRFDAEDVQQFLQRSAIGEEQ